MSDRVPICTVPGLASVLVDVDVMVAPANVALTITRLFLQRTDNGAGDVVTASIRNATAGGGEGIEVTLASTESEQTETGSVTVEATEPIYLRVSAADANSQNLRGWFEVSGAAGVTSSLTTLQHVKDFLDLTGVDGGRDSLINELIARVAGEVQAYLRRQIIQATATDEKIDSIGDVRLHTRHYPIISVTSLEENGTALTEDTHFECLASDKPGGCLARISGDNVISWASGTRVVKTTYEHGYATIPPAIVGAATKLAAFDFLESGASAQARFGLAGSDPGTGGTASYTSRDQLWESLKPSLSPYRRKF